MDIKVTPTPAQMESYEAIRKAQLLCDAENALLRYFNMDVSYDDLTSPAFEKANGFSLNDAVNPRSQHYILEDMVQDFENRMTSYNGNMSINACWEMAIESLTNPIEEKPDLFKAEGEISSYDDSNIVDSFILVDRNFESLKETVGRVLVEIGKNLPDGDYSVNVVYENNTEYIDKDEGDLTATNGNVSFNY